MSATSWSVTFAKHYDTFSNPAPCDGCGHWQRCKEELLACDVFNAYVQRNQHWRKRRIPDRETWIKIFVNDKDEDDK